MAKIKKLLIANRGEIARRIMRTCRQQGIATVAVYSEPDATLPHVMEADQAVCLGPAAARDSYLVIDKVIAAAQATGADAIHPGYGFLSENTAFAAACDQAGIIFVGPNARAIEVMGDKAAARQLMAESGVPVLPGFDKEGASDSELTTAASEVGFPLLIKAVAGGGGKGMRVVNRAEEFDEALAAARREASNAFGDDRVLLERYLATARHVEVQVFADNHGNAVHLFERDCSVQRRHQKIIEEAPAPGLDEATRNAFGHAAVQAAKAIDYRGAGTVEFLYGEDGQFYFMEMNTRLQVEHPVTEMITGEDLVAWQLSVAAGEPLPKQQEQIQRHSAAMEVRLYAENPEQGFLPSSGLLRHLRWPHSLSRVDAGYEQGDQVDEHYDPMIAKLICHGADRNAARQQLIQALDALELDGIHHNAAFLRRVLNDEAFAGAELDTRLLEHRPHLLEATAVDPALLALAAARLQAHKATGDSPWQSLNGWRPLNQHLRQTRVEANGEQLTVREDGQQAAIDDRRAAVSFTVAPTGQRFSLHWGADSLAARFAWQNTHTVMLFVGGQAYPVTLNPSRDTARHADAGGFSAPMSGTIVALHAAPGDSVEAGDAVITLEAMKMEHTLRATVPGTVNGFAVAAGDSVSEGTVLVEFTAADSHADTDSKGETE